MNARTILAQIITILMALIIFLVLQAGLGTIFQSERNDFTGLLTDIVAVIIMLLIFMPLKNFISQSLHRVIHRKEIFLELQLAQLKEEVKYITHLLRLQRVVVRRLTELMRVQTAAIFLLDESTQIYELSDGLGVTQKDKFKIQFKASGGLIVWIKMDKKPLYFPRLQKDKRFQFLGKEEKDKIRRIQTDLCLPLLFGDQIIGLLFMGPKVTKKAYTPHEIEILQDVVNHTTQAIMNATAQRDLSSMEREATRAQNRIRQLESRLTEVEKIHQNLLDYFKSGIAVLKIKDRIIEVNQAVTDEMLPELQNRFQEYLTDTVSKSK